MGKMILFFKVRMGGRDLSGRRRKEGGTIESHLGKGRSFKIRAGEGSAATRGEPGKICIAVTNDLFRCHQIASREAVIFCERARDSSYPREHVPKRDRQRLAASPAPSFDALRNRASPQAQTTAPAQLHYRAGGAVAAFGPWP